MNHLKHWFQQRFPFTGQDYSDRIVQWAVLNLMAWVLMLVPAIQQKSGVAIALAYVLVGIILFNTVLLASCSFLPNGLIGFKSERVEALGRVLLPLIGLGVWGLVLQVCKSALSGLDSWLFSVPHTTTVMQA
jgi:hypothetical protein